MTKDEEFEITFQKFIEETIREQREGTGPRLCEAAQDLLDHGIPIHYSDDEFPGETVKEYPDGRREIVAYDENHKEFVVRAIWPAKTDKSPKFD